MEIGGIDIRAIKEAPDEMIITIHSGVINVLHLGTDELTKWRPVKCPDGSIGLSKIDS